MKQLGIIIVNYNTRSILRECLRNLEKLEIPFSKIVVVDNGSKDGSADMVSRDFKDIILIKTSNNGLAAGYNLGIRELSNADFYLFLGADAFPKHGCIKGVYEFLLKHKDVGIATAKLVLRDGSIDKDAHRGFPTPWVSFTHFTRLERLFPNSDLFNRYFLTSSYVDIPHEIDLCISHFLMTRSDIIKRVGMWDESFFVYGEDVDMCWRVKKAGYKIFYLPQYKCIHYKGVTLGTRRESADITTASDETINSMKKASTDAMKLFYKKHLYKKYPLILSKMVEYGIAAVEYIRSR